MSPAECRLDHAGSPAGLEEFVISAIGVGLQDAGVVGKMGLRMLAATIARVGVNPTVLSPGAIWKASV